MKKTFLAQCGIFLLLFALITPAVQAAEIEDRSLTLSTSEPLATANYSFNFSVPTDSVEIESFEVEICEEAAGSCSVPNGFGAGSANIINQPIGFGDGAGWGIDVSNPDVIRMNNPGNNETPGPSQSATFGGITNPQASNETFFARMTTYENDDYTEEIDTGVVAVSTATAITITGFVPPILTFCVGVTVSGDCSTASGDNIDLGTFSPNTTASGSSQMRASTNAASGYVITVQGTTLSSGSNTIPALSSPSASQTEQSQFGMNLRSNTSPNVGSDPSGSGNGSYTSNYGSPNQFMFQAGDAVAEASGPTNANTYTASYITNIEPQQAAGNYTTTLTYIATATF